MRPYDEQAEWLKTLRTRISSCLGRDAETDAQSKAVQGDYEEWLNDWHDGTMTGAQRELS